jgi:hypothetical protein
VKPLVWAMLTLALAFGITGYIDMQEAERLSLEGYVSDRQ